jgi:hypothetical protein
MDLIERPVLNQSPRLPELVAPMATEAYEPPTEPPDWTFKQQAWMRR